jgi:hypothetical protein
MFSPGTGRCSDLSRTRERRNRRAASKLIAVTYDDESMQDSLS